MATHLRDVDVRGVRFERYEATSGRVLMTGVQALARAVLDQRRRDRERGLPSAGFVTGYPGSPLAGYDLELARINELLTLYNVVHTPGLNEELAATAIAGSQLALLQPDHTVEGVASLWYGKAPGLDRASDAIRHGNLMGTGPTGGVIVAVGDDPLAKSSSVPSTSEPSLYSLGLPILSPADPQDLLDLAAHGYEMSRASGLWVGLRIPASVADATQSVRIDADRLSFVEPDRVIDGRSYVHQVTAQLLGATLLTLEGTLYGERLEMARRYAATNHLDRSSPVGPTDVLGVVAAGPAYVAVVHALGRLGISESDLAAAGVRLLKLAVLYPLNIETVIDFASGLSEVLVVEDKRGFIEDLVKSALFGMASAPRVVGKRDERGAQLLSHTGEVDPDVLADVLAARLVQLGRPVSRVRAAADLLEPLSLVRGPYFCSGCPHNTSTRLPDGSCVGSGSGCHGLVLQMAPRQVGTVVGRFQMGGEGAMWNGMSHFVKAEHFFQNLGDGTFAHSGSLALRAAIAAGVNITYKLLVNSSVAMTGGQAVLGPRDVGELCRLLAAEGVARVAITTDDPHNARYRHLPSGVKVRHRREIVEVQRELAALAGVTVLIHDQGCALERRRRQRREDTATSRRVVINPLVCDGCGECGALTNCLSLRPVDTPWGRKTEIHQESCALDLSCLEAPCPAFVTVDDVATRSAVFDVDSSRLVPPSISAPAGFFNVRLCGVGGTGVVTVAQIISWAAHLEGHVVLGMDQTGIAQKGGSVVSDVRFGTDEVVATYKLGAEECDLYLGCEMLVAAEPRNLVAASSSRTVAVMSSSRVPTGRQVADASIGFLPLEEVRAAIDSRCRAGVNRWLDSASISRRLLGSDVYANVVLLGAAFQLGALPLSDVAIERAIELNAVAVEENLAAFRLGRLIIAEPDCDELADVRDDATTPTRDETELLEASGVPGETLLSAVLIPRIRDLIDYQDVSYARRYVDLVHRAYDAETRCAVNDGPFAHAVARQAHRLMAYRDEYEVARLLLDSSFERQIRENFGPRARVTFHLDPPSLRWMGRTTKIELRRGRSGLAALARAHGLRGGVFDPFARSEMRRLERKIRDQYESTIREECEALTPDRLDRALAIAELPESVRGYDEFKRKRIRAYQERRAALLSLGAEGGAPSQPLSD